MEVTAVLLVEDLDRDLSALGIELWLFGTTDRPLAMLRRIGAADRLHDRLFWTVVEGVDHYARHRESDEVPGD